jgi:hypothetical protein
MPIAHRVRMHKRANVRAFIGNSRGFILRATTGTAWTQGYVEGGMVRPFYLRLLSHLVRFDCANSSLRKAANSSAGIRKCFA